MLRVGHWSSGGVKGAILALGLLVPFVGAVCNGEEGEAVYKIAVRNDEPAINLLRSPTTSENFDAAIERLSATRSAEASSLAFDDLDRQADPLADAMTTALCTGMEQLGGQGDDTTGTDWGDFLIGQLEAQLPSVPEPEIVSKVNGVMTTWDLAQVNGGLARTYYQGCVAGG